MNYNKSIMNIIHLCNKRFILISLLVFSVIPLALSQGRGHRDRIEAQRIAFFTEKINLTPGEAENFWPVYNDFNSKKETLNREQRFLTINLSKNIDSMSEEEVKSSMEAFVEFKEKEHNLFAEYHEKFLKVLPPAKVMKVYIAELQFKQYLLKQIQNRPRHGRN